MLFCKNRKNKKRTQITQSITLKSICNARQTVYKLICNISSRVIYFYFYFLYSTQFIMAAVKQYKKNLCVLLVSYLA